MSNFDSATRSVAVVGGGISGLATAWRVAELQPGWRVVVLEAADRAGGVIHTDRTGDYTLELGPDSILRRLPWGVGLCQRLGIDDQLVGTQPAARGVYTVHRGQLARMPEGLAIMAPERVWPMVTTPILSPWGKLRLACERVVPRRTDDADESLAAFARRRLGREAFERIVQPMAGGIYMGDPERLSLRGCFPQFADMEAKQGSLIKATRQAARERKAAASDKPPASVFVAPRDGLGQIIDTLTEKLGGAVRVGQRVQEIEKTTDRWRLTVEESSTNHQSAEEYDAVVIATPAAATAKLIEPIEPRVGEVMRGIEYSSCVIVQLAYLRCDMPHPLDASGVVVPHVEGRRLQALSFSSVKYADRVPDDMVVLRAFFGGALRPELLEIDDGELVEVAREEVGDLLGTMEKPQFAMVKRWQSSMPQYHVGHTTRIDEVEELMARHQGLELAGAALRGVGIPFCIRTAEQAAERIVEQLIETSTTPEATP